ncbi:hypothetical protein MCUN1_002534 [Malassezia cuniculi]|uniref:Uncharacterized protein n=1 Tax=Malassezia cuniculi TaxID=948313 RepID=A0AAF0ERN5_9BASI|nr:hypothetical protein MCUN1_002534 [Malassezia cuniculi]
MPSHSDDVTSLVFHPDTTSHADILLSGGMDGLACVIDISRALEDDAVVSVGNTGSSLARVGWAAASSEYQIAPRALADVDMDDKDASLVREQRRSALGPVYTVSNMQTLGIWDADRFDALVPSVSAREPKSFRPPWVPDYVIDAAPRYPIPWDIPRTGLFVFTGDQEGGIALIAADTDPTATSGTVDWTLLARLPSSQTSACAHSDIVRSVEWVGNRLYTGGEDGCILQWNMDESAATPPSTLPMQLPTDIPIPEAHAAPRGAGDHRHKSRGGLVKRRYTPYK